MVRVGNRKLMGSVGQQGAEPDTYLGQGAFANKALRNKWAIIPPRRAKRAEAIRAAQLHPLTRVRG